MTEVDVLRRFRRAVAVILVVPLLLLSAAAFGDEPRYSNIPASADGIGKLYMGREISHVMGFHGARWLERDERATEERPDLVLDALGLRAGMVVADIGAGTGYYSWRIAQRVGKDAVVYAVDVQPEMIALLDKQIAQRGITNVKPILGVAMDPGLAPASVDLALMIDVYHEFQYPHEMLAAIVRALKPGGRLVFVEFRANDRNVPIKPLHTMTEAQVRKEAGVHALEWVNTLSTLPWQHLVIFRRN